MARAPVFLIGANIAALAAVAGFAALHVSDNTLEFRQVRELAGFGATNSVSPGHVPAVKVPAVKVPALRPAAVETGRIPASAAAVARPVAHVTNPAQEKARAINGAAAAAEITALPHAPVTDTLSEKLGIGAETAAGPDPAAQRERGMIAEVQTALILLKYDPGLVDGATGPRTRAAIRAFEADRGWHPTGRIDFDLLNVLGVTGFATATLTRDWFYVPTAPNGDVSGGSAGDASVPAEPDRPPAQLSETGTDRSAPGAPLPLGG